MLLTRNLLNTVVQMPKDTGDDWAMYLGIVIDEYGFTDPREVAAFLATLVHESAGFSRLVENLNYSAQGLANTWPSRYSSTKKRGGAPNALANSLHRKPEAIANNTYANRMGNGAPASGDGYRYRGHGPIQHTGKNSALELNKTIGKKFGIDFTKDFHLLTKPMYGCHSAANFWVINVRPTLKKMTNANTTDKVYMDVASDKVNRGSVTATIGDAIGFADRFKYFGKFLPMCQKLMATSNAPKSTTVELYADVVAPESAVDYWETDKYENTTDQNA